jgi:cation diffusion facilitator family transporter
MRCTIFSRESTFHNQTDKALAMVNTTQLNQPTPSLKTALSSYQKVKQVLWQVLGLNMLVAGAKIIVGTTTGSISMIADGFHSAMDASSNVIGLIGSTIADQPPDGNHPYGHQKYETFATLGIGLLLLLTSWNVLKSIFTRLVGGGIPEITTLSFVVMIITIILNVMVVIYEKKRGCQLKSSLLLADAAHTRSDIFVSLSVLTSLVAVKVGWPWMDAVVALVIVFVIGHTGWQIVRRASDILADRAVIETTSVERVALSIKGVQSCHKVRSRGPAQATHLDLHIQVNGQMTLEEAHWLGHLTQDQLKKKLGVMDVIVHVEPVKFTPKLANSQAHQPPHLGHHKRYGEPQGQWQQGGDDRPFQTAGFFVDGVDSGTARIVDQAK